MVFSRLDASPSFNYNERGHGGARLLNVLRIRVLMVAVSDYRSGYCLLTFTVSRGSGLKEPCRGFSRC